MRHIFEVVPHTKDAVGVQTIFCQKGIKQGKGENSQVVVIAWCSPYASRKRNYQLERDLQRVYRRYYARTLFDNSGLFWSNNDAGKGVNV